MTKKKQSRTILFVVIALVVVGAIVFFATRKKATPEATVAETVVKKKKISAPLNVIALADRPVVSLQPFSQNGGRFVSIVVSEIRLPATAAEYEVSYNVTGQSAINAAGAKVKVPTAEEAVGTTQGFIGELEIANLPTKTENRFGTCSAGGACINNNVSDGTLTINFDAATKYGVTSNWTYFEEGVAKSATIDKAFTIEAAELAKASDYLIAQAIGLPTGLTGEVAMVSDGGKDGGQTPVAYQINFTTAVTSDAATITFADAASDAALAVWDGKAWTNYTMNETLPLGNGYIYVLLAATT